MVCGGGNKIKRDSKHRLLCLRVVQGFCDGVVEFLPRFNHEHMHPLPVDPTHNLINRTFVTKRAKGANKIIHRAGQRFHGMSMLHCDGTGKFLIKQHAGRIALPASAVIYLIGVKILGTEA